MSAERSTLEEVARWSQSEGSQLAHTPSRPSAATPMSSGASSKIWQCANKEYTSCILKKLKSKFINELDKATSLTF
jgi:hypothetical protein